MDRANAVLDLLTSDDFALVLSFIMDSTDAESFHRVLRAAAVNRLDELAQCDSFMELLTCKNYFDITTLNDIEAATSVVKKTAKLASLSALMFCMGNLMRASEKSKLIEKYDDILRRNKDLSDQVERDKAALFKSKEVHDDAFEALKTAVRRASDAERKLQEVRARFARDEQNLRKAAQTSEVKVLLSQKMSEVETVRETMLNPRENVETSSSNLAGRLQMLEKQLSQNNHSTSLALEGLQLSEAKALILKLTAEKHAVESSLQKFGTANHAGLSKNVSKWMF